MTHYGHWLFKSPRERLEDFAGKAKRLAPENTLRILDVGCGNGVLLAELRKVFPKSQLVGVDISSPNINLAIATYKDANISFIEGDYLRCKLPSNDLIVSYSTINLIPVSADKLLGKVSDDLEVGGVFIVSMPYECTYNAILIIFRRILKMFRWKATDRLIYFIGRLITPSGTPDSLISQNIGYMYIVPTHLDGKDFRDAAQSVGLTFIKAENEMQSSIAKLKHRVVVFQKV